MKSTERVANARFIYKAVKQSWIYRHSVCFSLYVRLVGVKRNSLRNKVQESFETIKNLPKLINIFMIHTKINQIKHVP